jgi:hypothetical protein
MTLGILVWIGGSALVAFLGRHHAAGPIGFFLFSLIFSPVVGLLSLLVAGPRRAVGAPRASDMRVLTEAVQHLQIATRHQGELLKEVCAELRAVKAAAAHERPKVAFVAPARMVASDEEVEARVTPTTVG